MAVLQPVKSAKIFNLEDFRLYSSVNLVQRSYEKLQCIILLRNYEIMVLDLKSEL